jgi:hypothetical protein
MGVVLIEGLALAASAERLAGDGNGLAPGVVSLVGIQFLAVALFTLCLLVVPRRMVQADPKALRNIDRLSLLCGAVVAAEALALALFSYYHNSGDPEAAIGSWSAALFAQMFMFGAAIAVLRPFGTGYGFGGSVSALAFLALSSIGVFVIAVASETAVAGLGTFGGPAVLLFGVQMLAFALIGLSFIVLKKVKALRRRVKGTELRAVAAIGIAVLLAMEGLLICGLAGDVTAAALGTVSEGVLMMAGLTVMLVGLVVPLITYADELSGRATVKLAAAATTFVVLLLPFALLT